MSSNKRSNDTLRVDIMKKAYALSCSRNPIVPVFGSERKDQILNATILKAHEHANYGKHSPGPATYDARGDIELDKGRQFGVKTKIYHRTSSLPDNIGPNECATITSFGPQWQSEKRNPTTYTWGKAKIPGRDVRFLLKFTIHLRFFPQQVFCALEHFLFFSQANCNISG